MKNDQFIKLEVSLFCAESVEQLIDRVGMEAWGIYVALLLRMRQDDELTIGCSEASVAAMARRWNTTPERIREVMENPLLFVPSAGDGERLSSPYLNRVMATLWAKRGDKLPSADGAKKATVKRAANGRFTANSTEEKNRIEESRTEESSSSREEEKPIAATAVTATTSATVSTTTATSVATSAVACHESPLEAVRPWEALVDEMAADRSWMDMVGTHSGLGQLYIDHLDEVVDLFRRHIRLYDKGGGLLRRNDVRQYFANYLAAGSRTCQGVRQQLFDALRRRQTDAGACPYETIVDGRRTYLGRPIPDDAPSRPDEYAVWNEQTHRWER